MKKTTKLKACFKIKSKCFKYNSRVSDYEATKPWSIWYRQSIRPWGNHPSITTSRPSSMRDHGWNAFLWILKKSFFLSERSRLLKQGSGGKSRFSGVVKERVLGYRDVYCTCQLMAVLQSLTCGSLQNNKHISLMLTNSTRYPTRKSTWSSHCVHSKKQGHVLPKSSVWLREKERHVLINTLFADRHVCDWQAAAGVQS